MRLVFWPARARTVSTSAPKICPNQMPSKPSFSASMTVWTWPSTLPGPPKKIASFKCILQLQSVECGFGAGQEYSRDRGSVKKWIRLLYHSVTSFLLTAFRMDDSMKHAKVDRKSTRLNSSHEWTSYAVFCLKKKHLRAVDGAICVVVVAARK